MTFYRTDWNPVPVKCRFSTDSEGGAVILIVKHPREYVVDKLQYALNPKTIAVVGASRYSTKVGYKVVDGLLTWGYKGKIYPVNPRQIKLPDLQLIRL